MLKESRNYKKKNNMLLLMICACYDGSDHCSKKYITF